MSIYAWQQQQWTQLKQQADAQRLAHALLLTGSEGLGKVDFAHAWAQYLLCEQPSDQACGQCKSCRLLKTQVHPDFFSIGTEEKSRVIKIDQIRDLIESLNQTPQLAARQVVVIQPIEAMHIKAVNALLKTLEEPSGDVFFILVCHRIAVVPITLLSRCRALHFYLRKPAQALSWLRQQGVDSAQAEVLLKLAYDAPLSAKLLATKSILELRDTLLNQLMSRSQSPLACIDTLLKSDIYDVLNLLRLMMIDMRKCQLGVAGSRLANSDCATALAQLSKKYSVQRLQSQLDALMQVEQVLRRGIHLNPQLALERLLL